VGAGEWQSHQARPPPARCLDRIDLRFLSSEPPLRTAKGASAPPLSLPGNLIRVDTPRGLERACADCHAAERRLLGAGFATLDSSPAGQIVEHG
jgi:hypothetical protein